VTELLYQSGSYGGASWGLGSYNLNQSSLTTTTIDKTATTNAVQTGTFNGTRMADGVTVYNLTGTYVTTTVKNDPVQSRPVWKC
jgi:hypothetical protein